MRAEVLHRSGDQPREGGDHATCLVEVEAVARIGVVVGEAEFLRSGTHQHHRSAADHLDRGDVGEVADIRGLIGVVGGIGGVGHVLEDPTSGTVLASRVGSGARFGADVHLLLD